MPLGYEGFAGHRVDVTTVEEIVAALEARFGRAQRIGVLDRGRVSADNLSGLQERGRRYRIGTARGEVRKWSRELSEARDGPTVRDGVEARRWRGPDGLETFLRCRSRARREQERGMHPRFAVRIEAALEPLGRRSARAKRPLDRSARERQIGRLLERNQRAAARYQIRLEEAPETPARRGLVWSAPPEWDEWTRPSEGA